MSRRGRKGSDDGYAAILSDIAAMIAMGRQRAARSVNAAMTATYWLIGRRIIEAEQGGATRARYGEELIAKLSDDLLARAGRGFGRRNLEQMRRFFLMYPTLPEPGKIPQTLSARSGERPKIPQTVCAESPNKLTLQDKILEPYRLQVAEPRGMPLAEAVSP